MENIGTVKQKDAMLPLKNIRMYLYLMQLLFLENNPVCKVRFWKPRREHGSLRQRDSSQLRLGSSDCPDSHFLWRKRWFGDYIIKLQWRPLIVILANIIFWLAIIHSRPFSIIRASQRKDLMCDWCYQLHIRVCPEWSH